MSLKGSLISLASLLLGIGAFILTTLPMSDPASQSAMDHCINAPQPIFGVAGLDNFLCIIIPFFQQSVATQEGIFVTTLTLSLAMVLFFVMALEGIREGSYGPIIFPVLFGALGQLLGLGAVSLALFVPSFIFSSPSNEKTPKARRLPALGYAVVLVLTLLLTGFSVVMLQLPPASSAFVSFNIAFQFAPLVYIVTPIFRFFFKAPLAASPIVRDGFNLLGGLSFALYYATLAQLLLKAGVFSPPQSIITIEDYFRFLPTAFENLDFSLPAVQFLIVDAAAIFLAPLLALFAEGRIGFLQIIFLVFESLILSPGTALASLYADRETSISLNNLQKEKTKEKTKEKAN